MTALGYIIIWKNKSTRMCFLLLHSSVQVCVTRRSMRAARPSLTLTRHGLGNLAMHVVYPFVFLLPSE